MNDPQLRIGDAERAAASTDLGEHFAQGRLTADEHEERLTRIWSARTRVDLTPVFADLPSPYAARTAPVPTGAGPGAGPGAGRGSADGYWRSGLRPLSNGWPTPVVVILGFLVLVTVVTKLPVILVGLLVFWFVAHRHGRRGWQHRRY